MAKPHLTLHFHGAQSASRLLDAAREHAATALLRQAAPAAKRPPARSSRRAVVAVHKLASAVGLPVLLSLDDERLARALGEPAERKALVEGTSRGRLLPTPVPAFGADLRLLAVFEMADELRLNLDLWRAALLTPAFAPLERADARVFLSDPEPARALCDARLAGAHGAVQLVVDLEAVESADDAEGALSRLATELAARSDVKLTAPVPGPRAYGDRLLADVLSGSARLPRLRGEGGKGFDAGRDGVPLELLRLLADDATTSRSLAPHGRDLLRPGAFDGLSGDVRRGVLLRLAARAGSGSESRKLEEAAAAWHAAALLLDSLLADDACAAALGIVAPAAAGALLTECADRALQLVDVDDPAAARERRRLEVATAAANETPATREAAARAALQIATATFAALVQLTGSDRGEAQREKNGVTARG